MKKNKQKKSNKMFFDLFLMIIKSSLNSILKFKEKTNKQFSSTFHCFRCSRVDCWLIIEIQVKREKIESFRLLFDLFNIFFRNLIQKNVKNSYKEKSRIFDLIFSIQICLAGCICFFSFMVCPYKLN